jgi:multidrug efflux system outer membrane protein
VSACFWRGAPLLAVLALACRVGPDYERPEVDVPDTFRGRADASAPAGEDLESTIGELRWFEVFQDPALQELILRALEDNYDVRVAAERVLEARAFLGITRADLYPELNAGVAFERSGLTRNSGISLPAGTDTTSSLWSLFGDLSWEIDFWGRIRSATEAARADLLSTELARRAVAQALVSDLALAYFQLLELDQELDITRRTLVSRRRSLELVSLRLEQGVANKVELRQSESLVIQTAGLVPELERLLEEQENLIRLLVGGNPGPIPRGLPLLEQEPSMAVPAGLPSALLERRPDVRAAE